MSLGSPPAPATTNGTRSVRVTGTYRHGSSASTGPGARTSETESAMAASPPANANAKRRRSGTRRGGGKSRVSSASTNAGSGEGRLATRRASSIVGTVVHYARVLRNSTLLLLVLAPTAQAQMQIGFYDPVFAAPDRAVWLDRARDAGSTVVRMDVNWSLVAPTRPADPANPNDAAYRWATTENAVNDAIARGQRVVLTIWGAPPWAEQGQRASRAALGTWMPSVSALGDFARAAGLRFAGRVRAWQIWNEPNLSQHLTPQWRNGKMFSPVRYRQLLNAAYASLKMVDPANVIVTAGTGPYGDARVGGDRIMPVRFWRAVMCLDGQRLRPRACDAPASFDALAHHPYGVRGPRSHARNDDDVAVPDLARLTRIERAAVRAKTVRPVQRKQLWVTEISWDSSPPDPDGVPANQHAAWLSDAFSVLERQGVDVATWFRLRDQPPVPSFGATNQSGLYLETGEPKPALYAFMSVRDRLSGRSSATR